VVVVLLGEVVVVVDSSPPPPSTPPFEGVVLNCPKDSFMIAPPPPNPRLADNNTRRPKLMAVIAT